MSIRLSAPTFGKMAAMTTEEIRRERQFIEGEMEMVYDDYEKTSFLRRHHPDLVDPFYRVKRPKAK